MWLMVLEQEGHGKVGDSLHVLNYDLRQQRRPPVVVITSSKVKGGNSLT